MIFGITHVTESKIEEVMIARRKKVRVEKVDYLFGVNSNVCLSKLMLPFYL